MGIKRKVPFIVRRSDSRPLVMQVADGIRQAIVGGFYKRGDVIPSYRELAAMLGVSTIVTKAALRRISEEGLVTARPRIGSVVCAPGEKRWRGHVLMVCPGGDENFVETVLAGVLRDRLAAAGYLFTLINVPYAQPGETLVDFPRSRTDKFDFSRLDVALAQHVDLVVAVPSRLPMLTYLRKQKVPYVVFDGRRAAPSSAAGHVRFDMNLAMEDFAAACKAQGVKEVLQLQFWPSDVCETAALRKAGVRVRKVTVSVDESDGALFGLKRAGMEAMARLIAKGPIPRDTVVFVNDDYLAGGALMAIAHAGLKAPEDVRLVVFANKRLGPVYPRELTRIDFDAYKAGETLAGAALEYLKTGTCPRDVAVGPAWIGGETMGGGR